MVPVNENSELHETAPQVTGGKEAERVALFSGGDLDQFRTRWREVQGGFVDEPRHAVEEADKLVEVVVQRLTAHFSSERAKLEDQWREGKDASTEDLRQALRRYRSFFDRLLSI